MRWRDFRRSSNVRDRRGMSAGRVGGGLGIGGVALVLIASMLFGVDPRLLLGLAEQTGMGGGQQQEAPRGTPDDEAGQFVAAVLAQTEDVWAAIFVENGAAYEEPGLVLFTSTTQSGCGFAQAQTGPFYCPQDNQVYLDLSFFSELETRFGAPGEFAAAYVIAHEVGHHVQNVTGILPRVREAQRSNRSRANELSVRTELQADCYAGLWAGRADEEFAILEEGDVEDAINAAAAIGDDRLQRAREGEVMPDSFTHGSSAQRVRWFMTGLRATDIEACDTFSAERL